MARFYVGLRVRVVHTLPEWARFIGAEARIVGEEVDESGDHWLLDLEPGPNHRAVGCLKTHAERCLSPILPSGHQPADLTTEELLPFLKVREAA